MGRIALEGLTRRFGSTTAVHEVSLTIEDRDFLVLLGPSGCGKTTLLRMIAGLLVPTEGRITLDDTDITYTSPRDRDLALVFQSYALYPHLTVERNIGFPLKVRRRPKAEIRARVEEVAGQLELGGLLARRPKELSGGQRQRVALGRALVREPRAFLMDEPLSNLDAKLRTATRAELTALHRRLGATFVYVTHDQVEAMTMATRIALVNEGRIEQVGSPAEVYDEPASVFVAGFLGAPPMNLVPATVGTEQGVLVARAAGVSVPLRHGADTTREVVLGVRPEHLHPADPGRPATADGLPGAELHGTVTAVENHGSDEVALCDIGGTTVAWRGPRPLGAHPGQAVRLTARPDRVHLFDRAGGRRLVWRDTPVPAVPAPRSPEPASAG